MNTLKDLLEKLHDQEQEAHVPQQSYEQEAHVPQQSYELQDAQKVALASFMDPKKKSAMAKGLEAGAHSFDFMVRVYGTMDIKDSTKKSTSSIPLLKSLALALHYAGFQRENALKTLEKAVRASLETDDDKIETLTGIKPKDLDELVKRIQKEVSEKLPPTPTRRLNAKLLYEVIVAENEEVIDAPDEYNENLG